MQAAVSPKVMAGVGPKVVAGVALAGASLIAVTPATTPLEHHISHAAVRLTTGMTDIVGSVTDLVTGSALPNLTDLTSGISGLGGLANVADLGNLGGLTADLGNVGGLFANGSLANIPYNLFADVANIPYYESLALQEYAYALGPAGSTGGVAGWIPPGATVANGGAALTPEGLLYALGGTGSWYGESIGNTWGWDDGNWPQLDAISHFLLPFQFTESWAEQVQTFAQAEFIDGAHIGCEFECANPLGYLGGWLHGQTSLASLLSGFQYPQELTDSITQNFGSIINVANPSVTVPTPVGEVGGTGAIWSGATDQFNPLTFLTALGSNLTSSPANDPIQFPNIGDVFSSGLKLIEDNINDFNPFQEGSFLWWGAAKDYSIPSVLGGTLQDFTGIPNQWGLANLGAEPLSGYTSTPLSLPGGFLQGLEYFLTGDGGAAGNGLLGYFNPDTYLQALNTDIGTLTNPNNLLASLPLVGFLGLGNNVPGAIAPGSFLGTFPAGTFNGPFDASLFSGLLNPASLLGSFDANNLLGGVGSLLPNLAADLPTNLTSLMPNLAADLPTSLTSLLPTLGTDLTTMLGTNLATTLGTDLATTLGTNLATELGSQLGTQLGSQLATTLIPDLALQLLTSIF